MTSPLHDLIRRTLADGTTPGCPPRRDYIDPEDIDAMTTELEQALVNAPTLDGPPMTDTEFWCPVRNAYADASCGTQGVGVSHGHYDVEVDPIRGAVLTPPEVQAVRRRVASYYVSPTYEGQLTLWRGQPGDTRPQVVVQRDDFDGHRELWDHLVAGLRVES